MMTNAIIQAVAKLLASTGKQREAHREKIKQLVAPKVTNGNQSN